MIDVGVGDRPSLHGGQRGIGLGQFELPVLFDKLVAEIGPPRLDRPADHAVGNGAVGPHEEQRIGCPLALLIHPAAVGPVFAGCPQRGSQRIAGPERLFKVGLFQHDTLGLEYHTVASTLDVDRSAACSVAASIRQNRVGAGRVVRLASGFVQLPGGLGQLLAKSVEALLQFALVVGAVFNEAGGPFCVSLELFVLVAQVANELFGDRQTAALFVKLLFGQRARLLL